MRLSARRWRWIGLVLVVLAVAFGVIRTWVVPAVLVSEIRKQYRGKVVVGNWWLGLSSAGISGIELGETDAEDAPVWFSAGRISTNVSLGGLIRGRFMPTRIEVDRPKIVFHLDAKGQPTTKVPVAQGKGGKPAPATLPEVDVKGGEITLEQEGRQPMTLKGVDARLRPVDGGERVELTTDDPTWGQVKVAGHFDPSFQTGELEIDSSPGFVAEPDKIRRIPFIPAEVWANLEPHGPVDAKVKITLAANAPRPVRVRTDLTLKGTSAKLSTLQVEATGTTGRVVVDDATVRVEDLKGKTLDGSIGVGGTLDFAQAPPRFNLDLRLKEIDVTKTPPSWQLGELGATGKLTGKVDLRVTLPPSGVDLSGSAGTAVIENGSFQGIPIKSLSINMKATGGDLQFETLPGGAVDKKIFDSAPSTPSAVAGADRGPAGTGASATSMGDATRPPRLVHHAIRDTAIEVLPFLRILTRDEGVPGLAAAVASEVLAFQSVEKPGEKATPGKLHLPKSITTSIELEDVDLVNVLAKVERFGIKVPVPVAGKFSIKAKATIPLGSFRDIRAYAFHGDASLKGASIDHVDLGQIFARLDLADGVVHLSDFRGQFVDKPSGDVHAPPPATAVPPREGELPVGGFRASLVVEVDPRGLAFGRVEGKQLPLGELFAPFLPVPTPLSGDLTLNVGAKVDLAKLADPKEYALDGVIESRRIRYQTATLDRVGTKFIIKSGRLLLDDFSARLANQPLTLKGGVDLAAPHAYSATGSIQGWEIADVLAFVPGMPQPAPASGVLDAKGEASGTGVPFAIRTEGAARLARARAGATPIGQVAFRWVTDRDTIAINGLEAAVFGGKITGDARLPTAPGKLAEGSANLKGIDTARLSSAFLGKSLALAGLADGRLKVSMPLDASVIDAEAHLDAPDIHIRPGAAGDGVRVQTLKITARAKEKLLKYDLSADSLGGKVLFAGSAPIGLDPTRTIAEGGLRAAGFRLNEAWRGLGISGGLAELEGVGAISANVRATLKPFALWTRGLFDLRELRYGSHMALGGLRGEVAMTPTTWRLDGLNGELLGGIVMGEASGESRPGAPRHATFDFKVERASLPKMMAIVPSLAKDVEGVGSLRVSGRLDDAIHATAEVLVPRARVMKLPLTDLRLPGELDLSPTTGVGSFHARHWTGRFAGGSVMGNALIRLGEDRSFQSEVRLDNVDLEVVSRLESIGKRPASGKLSGKISLNGPNPAHVARMRGRFDLDLDDASLVELPVVRELDRFLGSARGGGLFEDGDVHGTIYNRTLFVEQLTLQGKLVQVHATGSVTLDGGLNLEVLVNTNQTVSQSGLALVNIIPGLGSAIGKGEETILRIGSFLSSRLLKFRVGGTVKNPTVAIDTGVAVGDTAVGFFSTVFKLPSSGK